MQGTWVLPLVRELRFHMLCSVKIKTKQNREKTMVNINTQISGMGVGLSPILIKLLPYSVGDIR